jgi:hypothetical protein
MASTWNDFTLARSIGCFSLTAFTCCASSNYFCNGMAIMLYLIESGFPVRSRIRALESLRRTIARPKSLLLLLVSASSSYPLEVGWKRPILLKLTLSRMFFHLLGSELRSLSDIYCISPGSL